MCAEMTSVPQEHPALRKWLAIYREEQELKRKLEECHRRLDEAKEEVINQVFQGVPGEVIISEGQGLPIITVIYARRRGTRMDSKKLKEVMPTVYQEFVVEYEYDVLMIRC